MITEQRDKYKNQPIRDVFDKPSQKPAIKLKYTDNISRIKTTTKRSNMKIIRVKSQNYSFVGVKFCL